jgi:F-type H+-transporting ATPase subunit epsilon
VTLHVALVVPEGEIWTGDAQRVIAKTLEGDIGVLTGHAPVLGILAEGSLVRILPEDSQGADGQGADGQGAGAPGAPGEVMAAIGGGFLSIADDRVSVLARRAQLGADVSRADVQASLDAAEEAAGPGEETADVRYFRALLRAAGDRA